MVRKLCMLLSVVCVFGVVACTTPSNEGMQGRLKASLPVDATLTFE